MSFRSGLAVGAGAPPSPTPSTSSPPTPSPSSVVLSSCATFPDANVAISWSDVKFASAAMSGSSSSTVCSSGLLKTYSGALEFFQSCDGFSAGMIIRCGHNISSLIHVFVASLTTFLSHGTRFTSNPPTSLMSNEMDGGSGNDTTIAPYPGSFLCSFASITRTVPSNPTLCICTGTFARSPGRPIAGTTSMSAVTSEDHFMSRSNAIVSSPTS
mmetsp:Transcript_5528/g.19988  ORF Transcript_5528/g.19988 Transcript_5528/m.19988 type:complete len:213 (-) Transcript_5528:713-1351(-)